jgi:hypothetical protein
VLEYVASLNGFSVYHDDIRGNYKITHRNEVVAYPSTKEDAFFKLRSFNNNLNANDLRHCPNCDTIDCTDCERFN